jgi:hypothetical protein
MKTVSHAYLLGLRDERQLLKAEQAKGLQCLAGFAREILTNIESTLRQGFSGEMAEYMRGGRDFWRQQLKTEACSGKPVPCRHCPDLRCERHRFSYVDGNNGAITRNSPELCLACYGKAYPRDVGLCLQTS